MPALFPRPAEWRDAEARALAVRLGAPADEAVQVVEIRRVHDHWGEVTGLNMFQAARPGPDGLCVVRVLSAEPAERLFGRGPTVAISEADAWRTTGIHARWYASASPPPAGRAPDCSGLVSPSQAFQTRGDEALALAGVRALRSVQARAGTPALTIDCSPRTCPEPVAALRTLGPQVLSAVFVAPCDWRPGDKCLTFSFHPFGPPNPGLIPLDRGLNAEWRMQVSEEAEPQRVAITWVGVLH